MSKVLGQIEAAPRGLSGRQPLPRDLVLVVYDSAGDAEGRRYVLTTPDRIIVGRGDDCDIEVADPRVSRHHCRISFDGRAAIVDDLGSANGTFVNGRSVRSAALATSDLLRVADTRIRVELRDCDTTTTKLSQLEFARVQPTGPHAVVPGLEIPGLLLRRLLGNGATSAVYEATDETGAEVAVKVLAVPGQLQREDRERFLREAQTASALVHPNIARVIRHGEACGRIFTVMELVRGETLRARLERDGKLPIPFVLAVARQLAAALEHARLRSVVHRDIKPENVIVASDGLAKVVDFGLAKSCLTAGVSGLTRPGDVLGTVAYMSPEQLESSVMADHRADVYSLGATMYHMLAGAPPFTARTQMEYFRKILREPAPVLVLARRDVPPSLSGMVSRCLRKNPDERPQTAGEIARLLGELVAADVLKRNAC